MPAAAAVAAQSAQMNVRIERDLKTRGDAALASLGFSPTEVIRRIWTLACGGKRDLDALHALLCRPQNRAMGLAVEKDEALERGWGLYAAACAEAGVSGSTAHRLTDEDLLELELLERYAEKTGDGIA